MLASVRWVSLVLLAPTWTIVSTCHVKTTAFASMVLTSLPVIAPRPNLKESFVNSAGIVLSATQMVHCTVIRLNRLVFARGRMVESIVKLNWTLV
jgi:hypothetical protein